MSTSPQGPLIPGDVNHSDGVFNGTVLVKNNMSVGTVGAVPINTMTVNGDLTVTGDISLDDITCDVLTATTITDGTATLTAGSLTGLVNVTMTGTVTGATSVSSVALITSGQTDLATSGTLGVFGQTASSQYATPTNIVATAAGAGAAVLADTTFTPVGGAIAYQIGDLVQAMYDYGLMQ